MVNAFKTFESGQKQSKWSMWLKMVKSVQKQSIRSKTVKNCPKRSKMIFKKTVKKTVNTVKNAQRLSKMVEQSTAPSMSMKVTMVPF